VSFVKIFFVFAFFVDLYHKHKPREVIFLSGDQLFGPSPPNKCSETQRSKSHIAGVAKFWWCYNLHEVQILVFTSQTNNRLFLVLCMYVCNQGIML